MAGSGGASKGSKAKGQGWNGKKASSEEGAAAVAQPRSFGWVAAAVVAVSVLLALLLRRGGGEAPTSDFDADLEDNAEPTLARGAAEVGREAGSQVVIDFRESHFRSNFRLCTKDSALVALRERWVWTHRLRGRRAPPPESRQ
mmetsp:Transcript_85118/g.216802  ORF Transcript_85118/g.216802 Transcript_85118/m.216802 type:complete len:143 (+) Transcript_85118:132-560(+)